MKLTRVLPFALAPWAAVLLVWAWHLKDPRLLFVRDQEVALIACGALLGGFAALRGLRRRALAWGLVAALALAVVLAAWGEARFQYRRQAVLEAPAEAKALSGHFIVGWRDDAQLREWVSKGLVGGVFITARNVQGRSLLEVRAEIDTLQALRRQAGLPPLIVSTDQEGGPVSRMSPPLPLRDNLSSVVEPGQPAEQLAQRAHRFGVQQGRDLASLGVNLNFSPVVDLKVSAEPDWLDLHTRISSRAVSSDPAETAQAALAYSRGLQEQGVSATLKHFPGLGHVHADTHHFSAALERDLATLRAEDWLPFREVATRSQALIMLGHVVVPGIDPEEPASMSRPLIQSVIRGEWAHDGLLVTDDLTMAAAYSRGLCRAAPMALGAGVDLLLIAYDEEKYLDAMYCAMQALKQGRIDPVMLERSRARLERWQARLPQAAAQRSPPQP